MEICTYLETVLSQFRINHSGTQSFARVLEEISIHVHFILPLWPARKSSKHQDEEKGRGSGVHPGGGGVGYIGILYGLEGSSFEVTRTSRPDDREEIEICDDCADEISVSLNGELWARLVGVREDSSPLSGYLGSPGTRRKL